MITLILTTSEIADGISTNQRKEKAMKKLFCGMLAGLAGFGLWAGSTAEIPLIFNSAKDIHCWSREETKIEYGENKAVIKVIGDGGKDLQLGPLYRGGLEKGVRYRVKGTLLSSMDAKVLCYISQHDAPYAQLAQIDGRNGKQLLLAKETPQTFSFEFVADKNFSGTCRMPGMTIAAPQAGQVITISDVTLSRE